MALKTRIEVDTSQVKKGLNNTKVEATKTLDSIEKGVESASSGIGGIARTIKDAISSIGPWGKAISIGLTAIGAAAIAAFKAADWLTTKLDGIAKNAKSVEMTGEAYLSLQHACNRAGLEMDKVLTLINKIDYALVHSQDGEKKYRDAFYDIGLSWRELERMSPEKRLMAINTALSQLKANGGKVPTSLFDLFGRKDMQTLNKMVAEKDFNKYIAEAGAMGYTIDAEMLSIAEAYQDSVGDMNDRMIAMVANWESTKEIAEKLRDIVEEISDAVGNSTGEVSDAYKDEFIGIGNVAKKSIMDINNLTEDQKKEVLNAMQKQLIPLGENGKQLEQALNVDKLSNNELNRYLAQAVLNLNLKKLSQEQLKNFYTDLDELGLLGENGFDPRDKSTWVKKREDAPSPIKSAYEIAMAKASDDADDLNNALIANIDAINNQVDAVNKFVDIEDKILEIEKKRGVALDEIEKKQLRINAAINNQKVLETEIKNLKTKGEEEQSNWYADMLGSMGVDSKTVKYYFESLKKATGSDAGGIETMNADLFLEYNRNITRYDPTANPAIEQQLGESDQEYAKRFIQMQEQGIIQQTPNDFASSIAFQNPDLINFLFNDVASKFRSGKMYSGISTANANAAQNVASNFSNYANTTSGAIDPRLLQYVRDEQGNFTNQQLEFDSADNAMQSQIYDAFSDAIDSIREGVAEKINEVQDLKDKIETIKKNPSGDPQRDAQKINELLLMIDRIENDALNPMYSMIDELENSQQQYARGKLNGQVNVNLNEKADRDYVQTRKKLVDSMNDKWNDSERAHDTYLGYQRGVDAINLINIAKREGLNLDSQTLQNNRDLLLQLQNEEKYLQHVNLLSNLRDKNFGLFTDALKNAGQGRFASMLTAQKEAKQVAGRELSPEEADLVNRLANLTYDMQMLQKPQMKNDEVLSNELAKRGGFSSSVRVDKADNNKEILSYQMKIYGALRDSLRLQALIDSKL